MNATCKLEEHFNKPYSWVCTNPACQSKRVLCSKCLTLFHRNCLGFMLHIQEIFKKNFTSNSNWIQNKEIKEAILLIEKYRLTNSNEQLIEAFQELVEKEFTEVAKFFNERLNEVKEKTLKVFKDSISSKSFKSQEFVQKLNSLYNLDGLQNILSSLQKEEKEINTINQELTTFFQNTNNLKSQEQELQKLASDLNSFVHEYLEIDKNLFSEFKESIPFDLLQRYSPQKNYWTWNPNNKSAKIILSENNTRAKRTDAMFTYAAVVGTMKFSGGHFQWELEVSSGNTQHQWITFGIVEAHLIKNLENFTYTETNGFSSYGQFYKMNKVGTLSSFDNKTFSCDLDLKKGTFTISCDGVVVCKEQDNLKGKTFFPFAILYRNENTVALKFPKEGIK